MSTPGPHSPAKTPIPSQTYLVSPGAGIEATLHVNTKAYLTVTQSDGSDGPQVQTVTVGSTTGVNGAAQKIKVYSANGYADGQVSIKYLSAKGDKENAWCSIDFLIGHSTPWDTPKPNPNKSNQGNPTILTYSSVTSDNIAISVPVAGGSGGIAWQCQPLNDSMVFLVDKNTNGNRLFRGNCPLALPTVADGQQKIDFQAVHNILAKRYKEATGDDFYNIGEYVFNDVNLQGPVSEALYLRWEIESMGGTHESQLDGQVWFPLDGGTYKDPATTMLCRMVNYAVNPDATSGSPLDVFDKGCAQTLVTRMGEKPSDSIPNVYYIHCASGHDRTGIVASSYLMINYPDLTLDESLIHGTTVHKLSYGTGQLHPNCTVLPAKTTVSPDFSRVTMISAPYNTTVQNIYNTVKGNTGSNTVTIGADAVNTDPAYVYSTYPWQA